MSAQKSASLLGLDSHDKVSDRSSQLSQDYNSNTVTQSISANDTKATGTKGKTSTRLSRGVVAGDKTLGSVLTSAATNVSVHMFPSLDKNNHTSGDEKNSNSNAAAASARVSTINVIGRKSNTVTLPGEVNNDIDNQMGHEDEEEDDDEIIGVKSSAANSDHHNNNITRLSVVPQPQSIPGRKSQLQSQSQTNLTSYPIQRRSMANQNQSQQPQAQQNNQSQIQYQSQTGSPNRAKSRMSLAGAVSTQTESAKTYLRLRAVEPGNGLIRRVMDMINNTNSSDADTNIQNNNSNSKVYTIDADKTMLSFPIGQRLAVSSIFWYSILLALMLIGAYINNLGGLKKIKMVNKTDLRKVWESWNTYNQDQSNSDSSQSQYTPTMPIPHADCLPAHCSTLYISAEGSILAAIFSLIFLFVLAHRIRVSILYHVLLSTDGFLMMIGAFRQLHMRNFYYFLPCLSKTGESGDYGYIQTDGNDIEELQLGTEFVKGIVYYDSRDTGLNEQLNKIVLSGSSLDVSSYLVSVDTTLASENTRIWILWFLNFICPGIILVIYRVLIIVGIDSFDFRPRVKIIILLFSLFYALLLNTQASRFVRSIETARTELPEFMKELHFEPPLSQIPKDGEDPQSKYEEEGNLNDSQQKIWRSQLPLLSFWFSKMSPVEHEIGAATITLVLIFKGLICLIFYPSDYALFLKTQIRFEHVVVGQEEEEVWEGEEQQQLNNEENELNENNLNYYLY